MSNVEAAVLYIAIPFRLWLFMGAVIWLVTER